MTRQTVTRNVCLGLFFFLSGVEYAVILPTLNGYLKTLGAEQAFLGIVLSAFSFSGLIAAPIFGKITDKTRSTKVCVVIGNIFEIVGNTLYLFSWNKYAVLGARLIAGIGSGVGSSIFGMISRTTTEQKRTGVFSMFMSLRQIGLMVGPAFNIFLHTLHFEIGSVTVNEYTSPGLLMATIWFLHTVILLLVFKDVESKPLLTDISCDHDISPEERRSRTRSVYGNHAARAFVKEFLREEVIVCLTAAFLVMFAQTGLEAAVTPMTLLFFGWKSVQNSYLFAAASVVVVISFFILSRVSKRISDRALMLSGCIGMVAAYALGTAYTLTYYFGDYLETPRWILPIFLTTVAILTLTVPFVWVPQASLFSKLTSVETQAFNQGIRIVSMGLGQILGPIWASSLVSPIGLPIMNFVDFLLLVMIMTMISISYKMLKPRQAQCHDDTNYVPKNDNGERETCSDDEETQPLLRSKFGNPMINS